MDIELELTIHEFLELSRKFPHSSEPINRKVVEFIRSSSDEIRTVCKQPYVEDEIATSPARDRVGQHNVDRPSPLPDPGPSFGGFSSAADERQTQPGQDFLWSHGSGPNATADEGALANTIATSMLAIHVRPGCLSADGSNDGGTCLQPGAGDTGVGQSSCDRVVPDQEQEHLQEHGQEEVRRSERLAAHCNALPAPTNDTESDCPMSLESAVNGSSLDLDGESAVPNSTVQRTQPPRQAKLHDRDDFYRQAGRAATTKRRKVVTLTTKDIEEVAWIENQVSNAAAQAMTRELVDSWDRIAETVFLVQSGPGSLLSRPRNNFPSDELSLFIYLGDRLSKSPSEDFAKVTMGRIQAAHFDRMYQAAKRDAKQVETSIFFRLSDERIRQYGQTPVRPRRQGYGAADAVRDRLLDLLFLNPEQQPGISRKQCRKRIHSTQQDEKRWRQLIQKPGYKILFCLPPEVNNDRMRLSQAQMDRLVGACEERLSRLDGALLTEFEQAMDVTFMPYIQSQLDILDRGGGFSALPGMGTPDNDDSDEDAPSTDTPASTTILGNLGSLRASPSARSVCPDEDMVNLNRCDSLSTRLEQIDRALPLLPPSSLPDESLSHETSLSNTVTAPFHDVTRDGFFAIASEIRTDSLAEDSGYSSEGLNERDRKGYVEAADVPAALLGLSSQGLARQREFEDVAMDDGATSHGLETFEEGFERVTNDNSAYISTDNINDVMSGDLGS